MKKVKMVFLVVLILASALWLTKSAWGNSVNFKDLKGQANLSWNESEDKNVIYKIYYGNSPRDNDCPPAGYAKNVVVREGHSLTLKDLEPGKTYYFSVSALNSSGKESCFSPEMSKKIPGKGKLFLEKILGENEIKSEE